MNVFTKNVQKFALLITILYLCGGISDVSFSLFFTAMAQAKKKKLNVIVEQTLSGCIQHANDLEVTGAEFNGIYQLQSTFVLVYYR